MATVLTPRDMPEWEPRLTCKCGARFTTTQALLTHADLTAHV